jgi:hypothetical protein
MSTAVAGSGAAPDSIDQRVTKAKTNIDRYTKDITELTDQIGKLTKSIPDLELSEKYEKYLTVAEGKLAKSKADLLKAEKEKAIATKIAAKKAKKAATKATAVVDPVLGAKATVPKVAAKSDKTPQQLLSLAELEVEKANNNIEVLQDELNSLTYNIVSYNQQIANLIKTNPSDPNIVPIKDKLKKDQDRIFAVKSELIDAHGVLEEKEKAVADQQKVVETVETKTQKEKIYEEAKQIFIEKQKDLEALYKTKTEIESRLKATPPSAAKTNVDENKTLIEKAISAQKDAGIALLNVKKELDALGAPKTSPSDEEILAAASAASNPPSGSETTATGTPGSVPGTTATPGSGPSPESGLGPTVPDKEVRFTFLKQRFIVENKFDGDKLLPKQRAFMEAMNILPVMASIDEKELVKVLENIVNNKNCRSDSWIGLSVKCGPIRTLLNTLADRLWVYLSKDPDILSRQARLATGAIGGPGSLGPSEQSGIPPGGHPFDPNNDTIITIRVPLRSLYESALGPITADRERVGAAGQNTRINLSNLKTQLINELRQKIENLFPTRESYSSSAPPPLEDPLRQTLLRFLETTSKNPHPPESIQNLEGYFTQGIGEVVDSYNISSNNPNRMYKKQEEELLQTIVTTIRLFENTTRIVPTIKTPPIGLKAEERTLYDRIASILSDKDTIITNSLKQEILNKISTIEGNFPSIEGYKKALGTAIGDILRQLYRSMGEVPDFIQDNLKPLEDMTAPRQKSSLGPINTILSTSE